VPPNDNELTHAIVIEPLDVVKGRFVLFVGAGSKASSWFDKLNMNGVRRALVVC